MNDEIRGYARHAPERSQAVPEAGRGLKSLGLDRQRFVKLPAEVHERWLRRLTDPGPRIRVCRIETPECGPAGRPQHQIPKRVGADEDDSRAARRADRRRPCQAPTGVPQRPQPEHTGVEGHRTQCARRKHGTLNPRGNISLRGGRRSPAPRRSPERVRPTRGCGRST